ncbi:UMP kinase [Cohaesibacter celericrescens]|uniref:Uridylate kinase n=1 Tax=Cohaesibacter celericrescens TaxID=2067669 RepID=A0A2N5XSK9_9HYPH|nr:UMP kinase [Cohaesibacter celericrescens]PLW77492.1 UMP kinase [Cohaesibacter celericrescens]
MENLKYKRILLKVSGEALMGDQSFGIDQKVVARVAQDIQKAQALGAEICVVIGGGNIFRGVSVAAQGGDRVVGDHMGMLATVMNCLAMSNALNAMGVAAVPLTAIAMPEICESFTQRGAKRHLEEGKVVLFAAGTGNPFFTTDSGAALRAAEMGCDALMKGTQVDGIYSADPKKVPDAVRYDTISHAEVLKQGLKVMDAAAIALAQDSNIPIIVFSIHEPDGLVAILQGGGRATVVSD